MIKLTDSSHSIRHKSSPAREENQLQIEIQLQHVFIFIQNKIEKKSNNTRKTICHHKRFQTLNLFTLENNKH